MTDFFADLEAQLRAAHGRRPSRARVAARPALVAVSLAVVAGVAIALAVALGGGTRTTPAGRPAERLAPGVPTTVTPPPAGGARVAVLNGTTQPGLARQVAARLVDDGFRPVLVTDATRQNVAVTEVLCTREADATGRAVAARLRVKAVGTLDDATAKAAGGHADVVVVLGDDARNGLVGAPEPVATSVLLAPGKGTAHGTLTVGRGRIAFSGTGLERRSYQMWLEGPRGVRRSLGYTPFADARGELRFLAAIPKDIRRYTTVVLTGPVPARPDTMVLRGRLRLP